MITKIVKIRNTNGITRDEHTQIHIQSKQRFMNNIIGLFLIYFCLFLSFR